MRNDPAMPEIVLGETICRMLKDNFYPETPWDMVLAKKIAAMLTHIKRTAIPFFVDHTKEQMLIKIAHYDKIAFMELCDLVDLTKNVSG
jgi:hypothetical protein